MRIAAGLALIFAARAGGFPGPEVAFGALPLGGMLSAALTLIGGMLLLGLLTELAALLGLILYATLLLSLPGGDALSYAAWLGVFLAFLVGGGRYSLDARLFRRMERFEKWRPLVPLFARVGLGFGLIFSAFAIKVLHPLIPLAVIQEYGLAELPFFPSEPLLILLGAMLTELGFGLFLLVGFQVRLAALANIIFMTLALARLGEPSWPHLILYGISIYLLVAPQRWTLDEWIDRKIFGKVR